MLTPHASNVTSLRFTVSRFTLPVSGQADVNDFLALDAFQHRYQLLRRHVPHLEDDVPIAGELGRWQATSSLGNQGYGYGTQQYGTGTVR